MVLCSVLPDDIHIVFSQMRVAIAYSLLFLTLSSLYVVFIDKSNSRFFKTILYLVPISIIILFLIINNIDEDFLNYITERSTNKDDNLIEERINIFAYFSDTYLYLVQD